MQFEKFSEQEIEQGENLPDGIYDATIENCVEKLSQTGNRMLKIILKVHHENKEFEIHCHVVYSVRWIVKQFCKSLKNGRQYLLDGSIPEFELPGQKLKIETMTEKGERGSFAKVKRFIELGVVTTTSAMIDDDLSF